MAHIIVLPLRYWDRPCAPDLQQQAMHALESGNVVLLPHLPFVVDADEASILTPALAGSAKNLSLDPGGDTVKGASPKGAQPAALLGAMRRFADASRSLIAHLLPHYAARTGAGRTSYRPAEIQGRTTSWRKDDSRLHVDSFPSTPVQGKRILRVFSNVNPEGKARTWRLGEPFDRVVQRFLPKLSPPMPGSSRLMQWAGITKTRRSLYDHYMLALHDRMKSDLAYQADVPQTTEHFPAGASWLVFTDQVSHAAMSGQYAFEQTSYVPMECMLERERAPLAVLERALGRPLVPADRASLGPRGAASEDRARTSH